MAKLHGVIEIKGCGSGINTVETPVTEKTSSFSMVK